MHQGKREHGDDALFAKGETRPRNNQCSISALREAQCGIGLEEREALEMAKLISLINKKAGAGNS